MDLDFKKIKKIFVFSIIVLLVSQPYGQSAFAQQLIAPNGTASSTNWAFNDVSHHADLADNDGDTSRSETSTDNAVLEVTLDDPTDPAVSTGHVIRMFAFTPNGGSQSERGLICLYEGTSEIACSAITNLSRISYTEISYPLTGTEADSIIDYTDLRLRITAERLGGSETMRVTMAQLEVPDANTPPNVTITSPLDGSSHLVGSPVTLAATAVDLEDGNLPLSQLEWISDIEGPLLTGLGTYTPTTAGAQNWTTQICDSENLPGFDTVMVTILPASAGADLSLTKVVDDSTPNEGTNITFTITITRYTISGSIRCRSLGCWHTN